MKKRIPEVFRLLGEVATQKDTNDTRQKFGEIRAELGIKC